MNIQKNKGLGLGGIVVFVLFVAGLVLMNNWLQKKTAEIVARSQETPQTVRKTVPAKTAEPQVKRNGEVIRKTRFSPDRKYEVNVFYQEGVEIARNKWADGNVYDQTGEIPNGKVKFINESDETYGVEYYQDQKRHGPSRIFYSDDVLKKEIYYQYGKLMTGTEYFHDGVVRMEEDYTNARGYSQDKERGIGKVYFRDGTLKYEWHLTVTEPVGFKKSYDQKGNLVAEFYYDEFGQPLEEKPPTPNLSPGAEASLDAGTAVISRDSEDINNSPKQIFIPNE